MVLKKPVDDGIDTENKIKTFAEENGIDSKVY